MTGKHTETPWVVSSTLLVLTMDGKIVANLAPDIWLPRLHPPVSEQGANAAFIVRAVNAHEGLVLALEGLIALAEQMNDASNEGGQLDKRYADARAALSAAKE